MKEMFKKLIDIMSIKFPREKKTINPELARDTIRSSKTTRLDEKTGYNENNTTNDIEKIHQTQKSK